MLCMGRSRQEYELVNWAKLNEVVTARDAILAGGPSSTDPRVAAATSHLPVPLLEAVIS